MDKEKWTEEILSSLDQQKVVAPDPNLYESILLKIEEQKQAPIPLFWKLGIAASFLVLVSLNVNFLTNNTNNSQQSDNAILMLQFDDNSENQLYTE